VVPARSDLERVREFARAGLASLEANRRRIDDLNVYPVPDGDTGTNLTLTCRMIFEQVEQSSAGDRGAIAREITRAALLGARGNSGVIFSQMLRGAVEVLSAADEANVPTLARALRSASEAAYRAVREPVEGTMLTVMRELAEEAERRADEELPDFLHGVVAHGEAAVARTEEQLDVLRAAGVVDAGGVGLLEIVRGLAAAAIGEPLSVAPVESEEVPVEAAHQELSRYRYCTTFMIEGEELDVDAIERELNRLGDSLLVVGDTSALKIHVHTDEPGRALSVGTAAGVIERVEIANMHEQTVAREERLLHLVPDAEPTATDVVAVVVGAGNRRLFSSLGAARIVEGGQTMNPSTADLVAAIDAARAAEVVVLPNNSNVVLTAEQAAGLSSKRAEVVPTTTMQAGLTAMVAFDARCPAQENADAMRQAVASVATGEVTVATRDVELDGFAVQRGAYLGIANGQPVAGGEDFDEVAVAVAEQLLDEPRDVLTLLSGADAPDLTELKQRLERDHPGLEVDAQPGGQPHYPLLLGAE
jgi:DAK2 domain fusion protein YloV